MAGTPGGRRDPGRRRFQELLVLLGPLKDQLGAGGQLLSRQQTPVTMATRSMDETPSGDLMKLISEV